MGRRVLIVGGVAGGAGTAARLRRLDETAEIILFERGEYISFANCGLPYYVGDVIKSRDALILQKPEAMARKFGIDVRTRHEVTAIDRDARRITAKNLATGESYTEPYDVLVLSTGSSPIRARIPGVDSERVMALWTIPDADRIRQFVRDRNVRRAVVVGGGFIGLEMAENLHSAGCQVSIVEMSNQVLPSLDLEMAQLLHENIEQNGVTLRLGDGVSAFEETPGGITIKLTSGKAMDAELVILSIGIRPNSELARTAGLQVNAQGGVVVDGQLRTSDPNIYAVGDVIEVQDFIGKGRTMIPLAGPANKQARICANNIMGAEEKYEGTQGTSVAKVFDLTAAATGASERALNKRGLIADRDYKTALLLQQSHAGYYPGSSLLTLKLIFSPDGKTILGAQAVGAEGVDKRIDVIATAIRLGGGVEQLKTLELAYAPPYSSAKDPVNMVALIADNMLTGRANFCRWDALEQGDAGERVLLDVREDAERLAYSLPGALAIPLGELRARLPELPRDREIIVFCAVGARSYNAARILMQNGFANVQVYPGGIQFYRSTHYRNENAPTTGGNDAAMQPDQSQAVQKPAAAIQVDCSGLQCPGPIMKVYETIRGMQDGQVLEVSATDPGFFRDIDAWCRRTGNTLIKSEKQGRTCVVNIQKGSAALPSATATAVAPAVEPANSGKTIVVFSGDLDKVLASFIIATGAVAMGRPVTMFFTFWGLNVLRRPEKRKVKKTIIESMFGAMMPRGVGRLKLSKMNMAGMGTAMMKMVMRDKRVDPLDVMIQKAIKGGVKLVACTMSMDIMGIKPEELIDGVELGGVAAYLGDAEESNVNLFI